MHLCVYPGPHGELVDEHLGGLGEEDGRLGRDHLHVLVQLHDLLDPGQRQLLVLQVRRGHVPDLWGVESCLLEPLRCAGIS